MSYSLIAIYAGAFILTWSILVFNSLIRKRNRAQNAWSDIDVQLKRRYDLVPNLVEIVKGYAKHEASVLEDVTKARISAMSVGNTANRAQAESTLTGALKNLFAVAENYPQLKASENFQDLQSELSSLENDIGSARRYYNATARELNNAIEVFPASFVAKIFNFKQFSFFGANEGERDSVEVSL